jgi:hypothetical protein
MNGDIMATKVASTAKSTAQKTAAKAPAKSGTKSVVKPASKSAVKKPLAKKPAAAPAKPPVAVKAPASKAPVAPKAPAEPSMRFYHSRALREKTHAVLEALEAAPGHPRHGDALADLVTELIEAGMDYYFMRALKQAKVGFVTEQSARMGMSGAVKLISSVNRKFIVRMDKDQLLVVAQHIRELT